MRAVLEFISGARRGQKLVLPAGRSVSVGRTSWSELVCDDDGRMSKVHFHLKTDEHGCYLQDHRSRNGTFVQGVRVEDCILRNGDSILAGDTRFRIEIEGGNPVTASSLHGLTWVRTDVPREEVLASSGRLKVRYTVETCDTGLTLCRGNIDAVSPGTLAKLISGTWPIHLIVDFSRMGSTCPEEFGEPSYLFDWLDLPAAQQASPVVISPGGSDSWRPVVNDGWGQDALLCLFSRLSPAEILAHLRGVCRPKGANGQMRQGMFGYCWPAVLANVLVHSPPEIVARLMTNIEAILVEFPDLPDNWQLFGRETVPPMLEKLGFIKSDGTEQEPPSGEKSSLSERSARSAGATGPAP